MRQCRRNFLGGAIIGRVTRRQTNVARQFVYVRIERNDETRRADVPETEIDAIGGANHPTQKKHEAFDGAAFAGIGQEMIGTASVFRAKR